MTNEFQRYGVPKFRLIIGALEILGALGLIIGYLIPPIQILAAAGLALLMLCGCLLRIKIRDSIPQIAPAFTFFMFSLFILYNLIN